MIIAVEFPDEFAKQLRLDELNGGHRLLEAFLLQRYAKAELTAGQVSAVLGLSFCETEQFLHANGAPGLTAEEDLEGVRNLERSLAQKSDS